MLKNNNLGLKKILGLILVILGVLLHLIPLFPASGIIVIGLELLGVRILLQEKIKIWYQKYSKK
jgi:hypothetical protein